VSPAADAVLRSSYSVLAVCEGVAEDRCYPSSVTREGRKRGAALGRGPSRIEGARPRCAFPSCWRASRRSSRSHPSLARASWPRCMRRWRTWTSRARCWRAVRSACAPPACRAAGPTSGLRGASRTACAPLGCRRRAHEYDRQRDEIPAMSHHRLRPLRAAACRGAARTLTRRLRGSPPARAPRRA
jgi:hypothetical protein